MIKNYNIAISRTTDVVSTDNKRTPCVSCVGKLPITDNERTA